VGARVALSIDSAGLTLSIQSLVVTGSRGRLSVEVSGSCIVSPGGRAVVFSSDGGTCSVLITIAASSADRRMQASMM